MVTRADPKRPLQGLRILVADDEIMIGLDLESTLEDAGAEVVGPFTTFAAALEAAADAPLSAAVLDIRLGHLTTARVAEKLSDRDIPFLFYSGQDLPDEMHARSPDAPLLVKPASEGAFVTALLDVIGSARLR
jgi:DNA-binding response OmpR family regulator